jgi:ABC-2 type transport system permease protein
MSTREGSTLAGRPPVAPAGPSEERTRRALGLAVTDSATMLRRNLRHMVRYPSMTVLLVGTPVVILLLFVYVFGGTLGAGLPVPVAGSGRATYLDYVTPGILLLTMAATAQGTAISVAMDMTEGIIARFRTMPIARAAVLTGHVLGSLVQAVLAVVVVLAVELALGFRPDASAVEWLAVAGLVVLVAFALTWLCVALGLVSKSVETASNIPMFLLLLPFLGSGFVPADSMPAGLRWFAEHQPFTPITETLRGLLSGTPIGTDGIVSVAWCAGIALVSYLWARRQLARRPVR